MIKVYKIIKVSDILNAEFLLLKSLDSRTRDHSLKLNIRTSDKSTDERKFFSV